ncbi:hypothetical protein M8J77_007209 [Diaphorina citri]|nr:hypothetical protein M8J77_007209 [Diaphorina citri]
MVQLVKILDLQHLYSSSFPFRTPLFWIWCQFPLKLKMTSSTTNGSLDPMANPFYEKVTSWLNEANVTRDQKKAIENLFKVKEIVIQKEPILLTTFLDTILSLQVSRNTDIKKFVVGFIEDAVKKAPEVMPRVINSLIMLLNDESLPVQKKVIQVAGIFYKHALGYISEHGSSSDVNNLWDLLTRIKTSIIDLVDGDNDGIRTQSIKFLETIVLLQTYSESDTPGIQDNFSLNNLPAGLKVAKRRQLEEEAQVVFDLIVKFFSSPHISSVNLMASMGSIVNIARMRPQFTETENKILRDQITNLNDAIVSVKTNIPEISAAAKPKPTPTSFSANTYHVPFKRISIFSDSMGRDLATNLRKFIDPKSITIYASVKPGAVFSDVIQPISNTCSDYTKDDVIFIMAGTNDMPGTSPASAKLLPSACLNQIAAKTNVIINSIPYRHDAHASLYARIQETNIGICAKTRHHKYTYFNSNLFLKRRHFTSHGLHFSKMGKLKFAEKFAMFLSQLSPGCSNLDVSHDVDLIDLTSADDDLLSKPIQRSDSLCQNTPSREVAGHKNMDNVTSNQSLIDSNFALDQSYSYDLTHLNLLSNVPSSASIPSFNLAPCSPLEIIKIVNGLQNKTSCGEDDIPMIVIKKVIHPISGPLSFIFNSSFSTSTFPTLFKNAVITPIHKGKGVMTDLNNFRPISLLNNFSKILEKLVAYRISTYLEHHNLLVEQQFGFRHGRSTSDAVAHFLQKLDRILASGQHAIAILCDLTKAFDCVDHALLLSKLPSFGIRGPTLHWIESYLSNRHQKVKVPNPSPPPVISTSTSSNSPPSNPSFLLPTSPHSPPTSLYPKPSSAHNQFSSNLSSLSHSVSPTSHSISPSSLPNTSPPPPPLPCLSSRTGSIYTSPYNINHAQPTSTFSNSYHSNPLPPPSSLPSPHNLPLPPSHINSTTSLTPTSSGSSLTLTQRLHNRSVTPFSSPPTSSFSYSSSLQVLAGVPQGSVLGPLLFLLYMNDITSADQSAHITLFADDTTILVSGSNRADVLSKSAEVMSNIQNWFRANKLSLNQAKTSYIYFNSPQSSSLPPIETPNLSLSSATEVKFLGLVVDSKLKWKTHIENLLPKLSTACFAVGSVRRNVDSNAALLSYFSYFHSVMSYGRVVAALELLHTNLPPTLSKSQVCSVRKQMKNNLLSLLKCSGAIDYHSNISTLLTDLGATYSEVMKVMPKPEEIRARQMKRASEASLVDPSPGPGAKKARVEDPQAPAAPLTSLVSSLETTLNQCEAWVCERLNPQVTTQIVLASLPRLPPTLPPHFVSSYTPIAAAGTPGQKKHVARLLATQFQAAGVTIGPDGVSIPVPQAPRPALDMMPHIPDSSTLAVPLPSAPYPPVRRVPVRLSRVLKLSEVTRPLSRSTRENLSLAAVRRILRNEEMTQVCGGGLARIKILTTLATSFNEDIRDEILEYLLSNLSSRMDLALGWLFEEYCLLQGFTKNPPVLAKDVKEKDQSHVYNKLLCAITRTIVVNLSKDKEYEDCLIKLYAEAPLITDDAIDIIKGLCVSHYELGLNIFYQMVICRPPKQLHCLNALLSLCTYNSTEIRDYAIGLVLDLYSRSELAHIIEEYASFYLGFLRLTTPPDVLFGNDKGRPDKQSEWNEDVAKSCIFLYLSLLSINESLIHELANVYVSTVQDVKRVILRLLEVPVRGMGMTSPELLKLIETCPTGAETLITRVVHILTEGQTPSEVLVKKIRELYNSRVSDVRFLIPVLGGLPKREILAALPKLIKLNPVVVKEVFNRLLGDSTNQENAPLTPAELMISLHTIDGAKVDLKYVIKATSLCFSETAIYTQEVLALVLQNLIEVNPLPTLFMRTVIQSLSHFPRLIGFIMNILQRLILKQVWEQKTVWEGFIKCCQRTVPNSYQVILQLPPKQLADLFSKCPELKNPLLDHVLSFTENQRSHIPQGVMDVLYGDVNPIYETLHIKSEPKSPPDLSIDMKETQQVM